MSAFRRFLNWITPPLVVPVEQLRPDTEYVERIVSATCDIRLCEDLFNEWSTHLNKCVQWLFFRVLFLSPTVTAVTAII